MKIQAFGSIAVIGMALTSAVVWSATDTPSTTTARPAAANTTNIASIGTSTPEPTPVEPPAVDRSVFTAGETLMMEGRLGHAILPAFGINQTYVFVDVKADAQKTASVNTPLQLAIVIDRSGSMRGQRLQNAIDAAKTAVDRLRDGDIVSILAYDTRADVVVPTTVINARTRIDIARGLRGLRAKGNTCISCAVEAGMRVLSQNPNAVSRILLLSDGEATRGVKDVNGFNAIADRCRAMNVSITSIGVDLDYNEQIMAALARRSNGRHYFVQNAVHLASIFDQEMSSLTKTIATNTEMQVTLAPGVVLEHVYDRTFRPFGAGVSVPLGTFAAGDSKTLLLRVRVPQGQRGEQAIANVTLSYSDLVKGEQGRCDGELVAQVTSDATKVSPLDGLVSMRISRSETAEALQQANVLFRSGDIDAARGLLNSKRETLATRRKASRSTVPTSRSMDMEDDFTNQSAALDKAATVFSDPFLEAGKGDAGGSDIGRSQIRLNQEAAVNLFE